MGPILGEHSKLLWEPFHHSIKVLRHSLLLNNFYTFGSYAHDIARVNFLAFTGFDLAVDADMSFGDEDFGLAASLGQSFIFKQFGEFDGEVFEFDASWGFCRFAFHFGFLFKIFTQREQKNTAIFSFYFALFFLCSHIDTFFQIQRFDFLSRPGRAAEKFQAGGEAGVVGKTPDVDSAAHFLPADLGDEFFEDHFQRDTVEGVVGLGVGHVLLQAH